MKRVLLLLPTTGYRNNDFLTAAKKLGVEIVAAAGAGGRQRRAGDRRQARCGAGSG